MAGTKYAGKTTDVFWNSIKVLSRTDLSNVPIGESRQVIDSGDAEGPGSLLGNAILPQVTVNCWYQDNDPAGMDAILAAVGVDTAQTFEIRPAGTGAGKTRFYATATVASANYSAPVGGPAGMNFVFACKSALLVGTQAS